MALPRWLRHDSGLVSESGNRHEPTSDRLIRTAGSHAYWYLSLANLLLERPGTRKRGLAFAAITGQFAPPDLLIDRFRVHVR
jgi:hypothetical protein